MPRHLCRCVSTADLMRFSLERPDEELPECEAHPSNAQPAPLALNDNEGLTAAIASALGVPVTTDTGSAG